MKIGFLGGAFNPFHKGHQRMLEIPLEKGLLDRVFILPSGNPPHKKNIHEIALHHRVALLKLMEKEIPCCEIEYYELIHNKAKTYTRDVLLALVQKYKEDEIFFILGGDSFLALDKWYHFEEILQKYGLLIFSRTGINKESLWDKKNFFQTHYPVKNLILMEEVLPKCASTEIRERLKQKKSVSGMLPQAVEDYIFAHGLYQ